MWSLALLVGALSLLYWQYHRTRHPKNFPPHPRFSIPLLGDALLFNKGLTTSVEELRQRFGKVFGALSGPIRYQYNIVKGNNSYNLRFFLMFTAQIGGAQRL